MTQWWHIVRSARGRHTLFVEEETRRAAVRRLARIAPDETLLFSTLDDHLHHVATGDRARAGRISHGLVVSLGPLAGCAFNDSYIDPVNSRGHLMSLIRYFVGQPVRHKLPCHPALWTGSCFQDLVGARWLSGFRLRIAEHLPRLKLREVLAMVELPQEPIAPAPLPLVRRLGVGQLADAACAALCVPPSLRGATQPTLLARRAVVQIALAAGFTPTEVARSLDWPPRTAQNYARGAVPEATTRAVRVRLALQHLVRQ